MARFLLDNARWLAAGLTLTLCSSFGQTYFISLFAGEIKAAYGLSDGGWGGIYTLATLTSAAVLIQAGGLADTRPLGRLAVGIVALYVAVAAGMALNASVAVLVALVAGLRFAGQGMMSHIAMTAMGRWFRARSGRAVAIAGLGHSFGEAILPALTVIAIAAIGWRATWGLAAAILALGFAPLLAWLLAESRQPRGVTAEADLTAGLGGRHWARREVVSHWLFWALLPGVLAPPFIGTSVLFHQVHVSEVKDWPLAVMALGYPAYAAMTVGSSLACGWLADRFGPRALLPVYLLPMGAAVALIAPATSVGAWHAMMALMGLTQGGAQTLLGALWPELYGTRRLGAIKALATAAMVSSTAIGPGITGALIDLGLDFPGQCWGLALWCALASVLFLAVRARLAAEFPPDETTPRPQPARARTGGKA